MHTVNHQTPMLLPGAIERRDLLERLCHFPAAAKQGLWGHYSPGRQPFTLRCHLLSSRTKQSKARGTSSSRSLPAARTKSQSYSGDISAKTSPTPGKWTSRESPITHVSPLKSPA